MDSLLHTFLFFLSAYSITHIFIQAKILDSGYVPIRPLLAKIKFFREMLDCWFCSGIWCSAVTYLIWHPDPRLWDYKDAVGYILSSAVFVFILNKIVKYLDAITPETISSDEFDEAVKQTEDK